MMVDFGYWGKMVTTLFGAGMRVTPALPVLYDTTYVAPTGSTIVVGDGGNFQTALNNANPGDTITLNAGSTYSGNFTLPSKGGSAYIHIRNSAALTTEGTRITTGQAAGFPKIVTPNTNPAIQANAGSSYYRFVNVESTSGSSAVSGGLIQLGTGIETDVSDFPHHIILDRSYVHGDATNGGRRGVMFSGDYQAVIDSYVSDWKEVGADTQAVCGWTGHGPYKIVNNYLEAAGENVMFGGADARITNLVPSDIEVSSNHFFKPLSWKTDDPSYAGTHWSVKNIFELKNASRVFITDNLFENCWADGQAGYAILFTVRNQGGTNPWAIVSDVTFKYNVIRNSTNGINLLGFDLESGTPSQIATRLLIQRNLLYDIGSITYLILSGYENVTIDHNTAIHAGSIISADGAVKPRFTFTNNIAVHNDYGIVGTDFGVGNATIAHYFPGGVFRKNVIVMNVANYSAQYPTDNFYPAALTDVGFVTLAGNADLKLTGASTYHNAALDGTDVGADISN